MSLKKSCSIVLLLAILLTLFAPITTFAAQTPEKVKVGYFIHDGYQNKAEDGSYSGYGYDYLQKIAEYANIEYEFVEGSWTECLQWLQDGTIDMLGFMQKTEEREQIYDFSIWNSGYNTSKLLTRNDNTTLAQNAWNDFGGISVGFVQGSQIIQQFAQIAAEHGMEYEQKLYETQSAVTEALKNGEVDAACVSNVVIPDWARVLSDFNPQPIYYVVAKGNTELLNKLNYAIGEIKMLDPTLEQSLRAKYYADNHSQMVVFSQEEKDFIASSGPITVAIDPNHLPIEGVSPQTGQPSGFTTELLSKISQLSGLQFEVKANDSYDSANENFEKGEYDILSGVNQSFYDSTAYDYSDVWLRASVVMAGNDKFLDSEARPLKIAVVPRTDFLEGYAQNIYPGCQFISCNTVPETLAAVSSYQADLALVNIYSF